jgi:nucleolar protein 16
MARPRQRKAIRNPSRKVSRKAKNRWNISFEGVHPLVKQNWDKTKTLKQNYQALGLTSHLNGFAGGTEEEALLRQKELELLEEKKQNVEWKLLDEVTQKEEENPIFTPPETDGPLDERVLRLGLKINLKSAVVSNAVPETDIIKQMREESANPHIEERHQSEQEMLVFEKLIAKYGEDYDRMVLDRKLNPYQLSAGQLKRKLKRYLKDL